MSADTPESKTPKYDALSRRDRALVDRYLACGMVQRTAYFETIYSGDKDAPDWDSIDQLASRKFRDAKVREAIAERLDEASMHANEVLFRLSQQAQNPQMAFLKGSGKIDLQGLIDAGLAHLVKGTKFDKQGRLQVEFYDAQAALRELAKVRGLTGPKGTEDDPLHVRNLTWFEPEGET